MDVDARQMVLQHFLDGAQTEWVTAAVTYNGCNSLFKSFSLYTTTKNMMEHCIMIHSIPTLIIITLQNRLNATLRTFLTVMLSVEDLPFATKSKLL